MILIHSNIKSNNTDRADMSGYHAMCDVGNNAMLDQHIMIWIRSGNTNTFKIV